MSALAVARLELRRLFVRPLGWVLGALTLGELAWRFVLLLGNFLAAQVRLAALPAGPGYTDLVAVPLLSSLFTGSLVPFGLTELALLV
ncbi:MAG: ABC transporter permease, partial [Lysobacterales bacterium 13-68-4]